MIRSRCRSPFSRPRLADGYPLNAYADNASVILDTSRPIPYDDYYVINLGEGEHLGIAVTDLPVMIDVQGPLYAEPAFFQTFGSLRAQPSPAGGFSAPDNVTLGLERNTDGANGERGYLWSDDGVLRLVAFHAGDYLIRVRPLPLPAAPTLFNSGDYTIHFFTHAETEPAHGKFPPGL